MNLDQEIRQALRRERPPEDFAERVLRRARAEAMRNRRAEWRAVAAALTMTAILGAWAAREAAQQRAGEQARHEVLTALRITSEKLRAAQEHVQQIGTGNE